MKRAVFIILLSLQRLQVLACAHVQEGSQETTSTGRAAAKATAPTPGGHFLNTAGAVAAQRGRKKVNVETGPRKTCNNAKV